MRIMMLFLLIGIGSGHATSTYSQTTQLSITLNKTTLKELFNEIENNSEYVFFYYDNVIDLEKEVSIDVENQAIDKILDDLFASTNNTYRINDRQIIISKKATPSVKERLQSRPVTGIVFDNFGEPLIGASIVVKGTTTGTITGLDGDFSIDVPDVQTVLIISYIGYKSQEISVGNQQHLTITLQTDEMGLDEVVVVGYGVVKKKDLTGAVASVNSEKINQMPATDAAQAIQGRIAGVLINNTSTRPGESPSVFIRGKRSISGSSDPLYVVDGIPITGGLNDISPTDIESIDVLKDASATAIYGARGSNGVIMITTKKGKEGKTQVDYNGYVGIMTVANELRFMNAAEYAETVRESYRANGKYDSAVPNWDLDQTIPSFSNDPYTLESLRMAYDANGNYDPSKVRSDSEWWKAIQRTGMNTNHQVDIRGGNSKTKFLFGGTYQKINGIIKDEDFQRYSIRMNLDHEISRWFKIGGQTQFSHSVQNRGSNLANSFRVMPMGRLYDDDGSVLPRVSGTDDQWYNPLMKLVEGAVEKPYKVNSFMGSYYAEITLPVDGLRFRSNLGLSSRSIQDYDFQSGAARNTNLNYAKNATENHYSYTWENLVYYDKTVGDHSFGVTLLQSIQEYVMESNEIPVQGMPSDDLLYYDVSSASTPGKVLSDKYDWRLASFMGRLNYSYKGRYLFTVSTRYDGSSRLADGHKWVMFPAASAAWRINDEAFLSGIEAISNLKLRVGYGTVASSEVDPYATRGTLSMKYYNYGTDKIIGYAPELMPNNTLTWETTGQWNAGIDFGFFRGRISGTMDIYLQNTKNLLLDRQLPVVSGFDKIKSNVGRTRNKGIELNLSTINIQKKDFTWSTDWMVYTNKEEIVELYNGKEDDPGNAWFIGEAIDVFYDYKKVGIWQDTPEDLAEMAKFNENGSNFKPGDIRLWDNGDYNINSDDRVILGQYRPKVVASINNTFIYKNFDLNIYFLANFGGMVKNDLRYLNQAHRNGNVKVNYWTPDNPTNDFPRPIEGVDYLPYYETLQYQKTDFIRLKNVTLGYTLPKHLGKKLDMSRCRIYIQADNPWFWSKFD
ncbi:MAG: TonB-dependent receptor [Tannerellaceae bacterium]|nr:TonB-dependent receptor [Tannerellaceae bacterium]